MFTRSIVIERPFNKPLTVKLYPFGVGAVQSDLKEDSTTLGHKQYPFLNRHLFGQFWFMNPEFTKFPADKQVWAIKIDWGFWIDGDLKAGRFVVWRTVADFKECCKNRERRPNPIVVTRTVDRFSKSEMDSLDKADADRKFNEWMQRNTKSHRE